MPGIYIHIPFCRKACHYCDFHFSTNLRYRDRMLEALHREIGLRKDELQGAALDSIYLGGGTPSLLSEAELNSLLETISGSYPLDPGCEITLEANPDDLDDVYIRALRNTQVNRLSIGVQSFFDEDLRWMNRSHTAAQAREGILRAQDAGFANISMDLIYGYRLLGQEKWQENIRSFLGLGIPHLSSYQLTIEAGTALASRIGRGREPLPEEEQCAVQYEYLMDEMERNGFIQYEVSSFCREGYHSRHNSSYWKEQAYLGIGPSAHSYDGRKRRWNIRHNYQYMQALEKGEQAFSEEVLSPEDRLNERIMTGLRTSWGLDLEKIRKDFGIEEESGLLDAAKPHLGRGWLLMEGTCLLLSREGKLFADRIASDLFRLPGEA